MIHLGVNFSEQVWSSFNGWLRTIRKPLEPSELVVSNALAATFTNYIRASNIKYAWVKLVKKYRAQQEPEVQEWVA